MRSLECSTFAVASLPRLQSRLRNDRRQLYGTPLVVLGLPYRTVLKLLPMPLDLLQDHLFSCIAQTSIFLRSSTSASSQEWHDNVPTFSDATRCYLRCGTFGLTQFLPMPSSHQDHRIHRGRRSIISWNTQHHQHI